MLLPVSIHSFIWNELKMMHIQVKWGKTDGPTRKSYGSQHGKQCPSLCRVWIWKNHQYNSKKLSISFVQESNFSLKICSNIVKMLQRPCLILCCFDAKDSLGRKRLILDYRLPFTVEENQGKNSGKRSWRNTGYAWFQWYAQPPFSYNPETSVHCWYCPWWASLSHISQQSKKCLPHMLSSQSDVSISLVDILLPKRF